MYLTHRRRYLASEHLLEFHKELQQLIKQYLKKWKIRRPPGPATEYVFRKAHRILVGYVCQIGQSRRAKPI